MRKVSSGVIGLRYEEQDVRNKSEGDLCSLDSLGKVRRGEKSQDNMVPKTSSIASFKLLKCGLSGFNLEGEEFGELANMAPHLI
ncbi:hypothetical protein Tco_1448073 [Tanacetum coccineum]